MGAPPLDFVGWVLPGSDIFGARAEVLGHGLRTAVARSGLGGDGDLGGAVVVVLLGG